MNRPFVASVGLLVINDHWLKYAAPSWLTGKLSDAAGLFAFPLLLQAIFELAAPELAKKWARRVLVVSVVATAAAFSAVKLSTAAAAGYRIVFGASAWIVSSGAALIVGAPTPPLGLAALTMDPTDLFALPCCFIAYALGARRLDGAR